MGINKSHHRTNQEISFEEWFEEVKREMKGKNGWDEKKDYKGAFNCYMSLYTPEDYEEEWYVITVKNNPQHGKHPDLFGDDTNVYVSLQSMTLEELQSCVPSDFSESEWNEIRSIGNTEENSDLLNTIIDNNRPFLKHVDKCVHDAIQSEIERLKSPAEAKRRFIADISVSDIDDVTTATSCKEAREFAGRESWLEAELKNPMNWDLYWTDDPYEKESGGVGGKYGQSYKKHKAWYYGCGDKENVTLDIVFSGDDIVRFNRLVKDEQDRICEDIEGSRIEGAGKNVVDSCKIDIKKHKITVEFEMPGFYVGDVRWSTIDKSNVSEEKTLKDLYDSLSILGKCILAYYFQADSIKQCSTVSQITANYLHENGFKVTTDYGAGKYSGHFDLAAKVNEGWYSIDPSFMQFHAPYDMNSFFGTESDPSDAYLIKRGEKTLEYFAKILENGVNAFEISQAKHITGKPALFKQNSPDVVLHGGLTIEKTDSWNKYVEKQIDTLNRKLEGTFKSKYGSNFLLDLFKKYISLKVLFIDEVVNLPEPKRTETLELMASRGDKDAADVLISDRKPKKITSYTPEEIIKMTKYEQNRDPLRLECLLQLTEHYFGADKRGYSKNLLDYLVNSDGAYRAAEQYPDSKQDCIQVLKWMHEYSYGSLGIKQQYEYFLSKIELAFNNKANMNNSESVLWKYISAITFESRKQIIAKPPIRKRFSRTVNEDKLNFTHYVVNTAYGNEIVSGWDSADKAKIHIKKVDVPQMKSVIWTRKECVLNNLDPSDDNNWL